ncbi:MAG: SDR family oxidoreductase [Alphaproteobacteria bacterium]|nr:SDR family oxidoreductase [Alphaproteobacteria bacterium]
MHRPALPPLGEVFAGRHLVVTGVTGFLGKVWLAQLLTHLPDVGRITLLVRGQRKATAAQRVATMIDTSPAFRPLRHAVRGDLGAWLDARIEVVDADLALPDCGLDAHTARRVLSTADAIVHVAGLTDFQPDPRKSFPVNVHGTRHVADLTRFMATPRLLHVSTCFVAGAAQGVVEERLVPGVSPRGLVFDVHDEIAACQQLIDTLPTPAARIEAVDARARALGWPNLYTFSKGLGEHLLATLDVDAVTARPSVIECARTFPEPAWNEGLNTSGPIMWFCGTAFPALPSTADHTFDIIPVDAVSRWLTVILARHLRGEAHEVYQLASGDVNPASFGRIVELTALGKRRHAGRPGARLSERLVAHLDVRSRPHDDLPWLTPDRVEGLGRDLHALLGALDPTDRLPAPLQRGIGGRLAQRVKDARRAVAKANRTSSRLVRMLEVYRPFIHDHDWTFVTGNVRGDVAALHPDDRAVWHDDITDLCWRTYWLDVQYTGMVRWAFPLMEGGTVAEDPPSEPALALGRHRAPWHVDDAVQGVA